MRSVIGRARDRVLRTVDRSERSSKAIVAIAVSTAAKMGADRRVLAEAGRSDLPVNRSLQIVQWSLAVAGRMPYPRHFSPGDHLVGPEGRAAAAGLLREFVNAPPDVERQLIGLDDEGRLDDIGARVRADLDQRMSAAAARPKRGRGLAPELQLALVRDVGDHLAPHSIRPFLMSGSLLGLIRDGDLMAHDHDVDLGLLPGTDASLVIEALDADPSMVVQQVGPRIVVTHDSGAIADVFEHTLRDGLFWHSTLIHEWWNTPFGLVSAGSA